MEVTDEKIGKLGFGMMRLPKNNNIIDLEKTKTMVDMFIEAGFNYFDTAWSYEGSEEAVREALVERYPRESYFLATKNAAWAGCKSKEEAVSQLETSLRRSNAGYFDFYLMHNLGENRTECFDNFDLWNWAVDMKKKGLIKHIGFSFHAGADELEMVLKTHPQAEFVQLQINYADWNDDGVQSRKNYEMVRKYKKPVIIMEPVKGGILAEPPESVGKILKDADPDSSAASWALRFAADLEGVITVLSGMSTPEQVSDNIKTMKNFTGLSDFQRRVLDCAVKELNSIPVIPCTSCDYCGKVCPMNIGISGSFKSLNFFTMYGNKKAALNNMHWRVDNLGKERADKCIKCGLCEKACPQGISIRSELENVSKKLLL